jgi:chromosomal replication initiator protein
VRTQSAIDNRQLWQNALADIQLQVRPEDFRTWFRNTSLLACEGSTCIVGVENPFNLEWLRTKCSAVVGRTLEGLLGMPVQVKFIVGRPEPTSTPPAPLRLSSPSGRRGRANGRQANVAETGPAISPRYTFDTFVVGSNNRLAHAASVAVANRPGQAHNPLFIYGGVGLGKTHLLHAIGHAALARGLEVIYVSTETFMNDFIESIARKRSEDFRAKYRRTQVLLIDDIHFIKGKEATQEEFFHTFNAVHQANGQIVITSDRHPRAIAPLEERLRSRFVWGLMADIQPPDFETRTAILRAKVEDVGRNGSGSPVPIDVLDFIAEKVPSNIRELEGALNRVLAYADLARTDVTLDSAAAALHELIETDNRRSFAPDEVIAAVCTTVGVAPDDLKSPQRDRRVLVPRQIAMYLLREETDLSLAEVGSYFGGRDHSTVLHSCEKVAAELEHSEQLRSRIHNVREALARSR